MGTVYLSGKALPSLVRWLENAGENLIFIDGAGSFADPRIQTHADIYCCQMGLAENAQIWHGSRESIRAPYPGDAVCNGVATGRFFVHNTGITCEGLMERVKELDLQIVHVAQGYARCSCLPVDDESFITADRGIAKALERAGAQVLLISPGHVKLEGYDYGFIGGCAGNIVADGRQTIVFNGDVSAHPDWCRMYRFIRERGIDIRFFEGEYLEDIGSVLQSMK